MKPAHFRGVYRDDDEARAVYSESAGVARVLPRAVAIPADADDLVALVRHAAESRTPLIARGSGSSMANGAVGDGVIVDLSRWRDIGPVDRERRTVRCGPGALRDQVDAAAGHAGLAFMVDPSSGAFCTVGGMCATNAAGARSVKFGATRAWVSALDCVFADGSRALIQRGAPVPAGPAIPAIDRFLSDVAPRIPSALPQLSHVGVRKESSGYALAAWHESHELIDLLVASEGTLALFAGVELLLGPPPAATASVFAIFSNLEDATAAAGRCAELGASAVELLDRTFLDIVRSASEFDLPLDTEAALIVECEGISASLAQERMRELAACVRACNATNVWEAPDSASETALWAIRHAASPILNKLDPNLSSMQLVEDGAVPPARFPEYVRGVRAIFARHQLRCAIFGHAGDAHAHVNTLIDVREPDWRARAERVLDEVTALVTSLGGTIAAEHGDGRLRTPLLDRVWSSEATELFRATKLAFDPDGILNPGVKVPLAGQQSLGDIKYDPALAPLPVAARAALDAVVREKGWAHHRLDLL